MELSQADRQELLALSHRYAAAVDRRDYDSLATVFADDAVLVTSRGETAGRDAVMSAMRGIERFDRTFHLLGQAVLSPDRTEPDVARGEVYCLAHHFTAVGPDDPRLDTIDDDRVATAFDDMVMQIIYADRYERHDTNWVIARRELDMVARSTQLRFD